MFLGEGTAVPLDFEAVETAARHCVLTSTCFESNPPFAEADKRKFGYSRDKRADCVQVVVALIITPDGFPLAYEVLAGNTADKTTFRGFLQQIEQQYGTTARIWLMDRGIPTEAALAEMRASTPPITMRHPAAGGSIGRWPGKPGLFANPS